MSCRRIVLLAVLVPALVLAAGCGEIGPHGEEGESGPAGPPGTQRPPVDVDNGTSVELCIDCHGPAGPVPVADITDTVDAHYVDTDPLGPQTASGYRQLNVTINSLDVTGSRVIVDFTVTDELGGTVTDIFAADGRFTLARLLRPSASSGDSSYWDSLIISTATAAPGTPGEGNQATQATYERFTTAGGTFQYLGAGEYRYASDFDPSSDPLVPVESGATYRVAIQLSAGDLPAANAWCDFDADLTAANDCSSAVSNTRDIVQTITCNACHGATSDSKLAIHGGGRTEVEYCVTCHNPGSTDPDSGNTLDMKVMIHKIHYGANLTNLPYILYGYGGSQHDYSNVRFTKDIDSCTVCHADGGIDEANWASVPTQEACGSCHDNVNFETGENHSIGVPQDDNRACKVCHPPDEPGAGPVSVVHRGPARKTEAALYAGGQNGFAIEDVTLEPGSNELTIDYSVTKQGVGLMNLATAPEWTAGGGASRLAITVGWDTFDYTNEGTSSTPASPPSIDALDIGGVVTDNPDGTYTVVATLPPSASNTLTVSMEGHPADLDGHGTYSNGIAVKNVFVDLVLEAGRTTTIPRRQVVDVNGCNQCHDAAGQGISHHGDTRDDPHPKRTGQIQVCVVCHNANNTDINGRPSDPTTTLDGKAEESLDFKRMIHQIHAGIALENGIVVYGFGNSARDFRQVNFIGNLKNCELCHDAGTYGAEQAWNALPSTISTGAAVGDPDDDSNVSPTAAVCSACHDDAVATQHMVLHGASFKALDNDIQ